MKHAYEAGASATPPSGGLTSNGYPADGQTIPGAGWFHAITSELVNVIEAAGLTPSATVFTQLLQALRTFTPPGQVAPFARSGTVDGWLPCDGQAVSRTSYADLFAAIGTTFGPGNGSTTFNLPDLRGEFVRGLDAGRGVDTGRALGSAQGPLVPETGWGTTGGAPGTIDAGRLVVGSGIGEAAETLESLRAAGGDLTTGDTRPRNVALRYYIKT